MVREILLKYGTFAFCWVACCLFKPAMNSPAKSFTFSSLLLILSSPLSSSLLVLLFLASQLLHSSTATILLLFQVSSVVLLLRPRSSVWSSTSLLTLHVSSWFETVSLLNVWGFMFQVLNCVLCRVWERNRKVSSTFFFFAVLFCIITKFLFCFGVFEILSEVFVFFNAGFGFGGVI